MPASAKVLDLIDLFQRNADAYFGPHYYVSGVIPLISSCFKT